jgi:5-methyltetrahydropteroyltriglutamate--homocysteine methyltransferase
MSTQSVEQGAPAPADIGTPRAEVVGSLLRPPALVDARKRAEAGDLSPAELKRIEDQEVDAAVQLQEDAGIDVVTDGELRRYAFYGHLAEAFDGFDKLGGWAIPFRDETGEELVLRRPVVVERLRWRRSMCAEEWTYLRARGGRPAKVTLLSAQQAAAYYDPEKSASAYRSRDEYLADIVDVSRR